MTEAKKPPKGKKPNTEKFTLHPRSFEDAVREVWAAEPPAKDGKASEAAAREHNRQIESGEATTA